MSFCQVTNAPITSVGNSNFPCSHLCHISLTIRNVSEMLPQNHTMEKCDIFIPIIHSQLI